MCRLRCCEVSAVTGQVREAWAALAAREGWEKLPKYALGVSSGASMVHPHFMASTPLHSEVHLKIGMSINIKLGCLRNGDLQIFASVAGDPQICKFLQVLFLALRMQLDGIVPQIMSLPPHMLEEKPLDPATGKSWSYPPTYFMHMALDHATAQRVSADIAVLKSKQVGCIQKPMDSCIAPIYLVHPVHAIALKHSQSSFLLPQHLLCHLRTLNTRRKVSGEGLDCLYHASQWYLLSAQRNDNAMQAPWA